MLVTAVLAVVLIAASLPFTIMWWGEGTTEYEVDWEQAEVGSDTAQLTAAPQTAAPAEVRAPNVLVSNVTVTLDNCVDTLGTGNLNAPAQMTWRLSVRHDNGTTETLDQGSFDCADDVNVKIQRAQRPTIGAREVESGSPSDEREAARAAVWDAELLGSLNETATYVLELSSTRGPATIPLGAPAPSLAVTMTLTVERWEALVQEVGGQEEVR